MAQASARELPAYRATAATIVSVLLLTLAAPAFAPPIDYFDAYRYSVEINTDDKLCKHMQAVYSSAFRQPWDYRERSTINAVPRFDYVTSDPLLERYLFFSLYPSTPEFEQVRWKEGRGYFGNDERNATPILVAQLDIDNDGVEDLVIKHGFMLAVCGGGGSCPGGE